MNFEVELQTCSFCQSSGEIAARNLPYMEYLRNTSWSQNNRYGWWISSLPLNCKYQLSTGEFLLPQFWYVHPFQMLFLLPAQPCEQNNKQGKRTKFLTFSELPLLSCHFLAENYQMLVQPVWDLLLLSWLLLPLPRTTTENLKSQKSI